MQFISSSRLEELRHRVRLLEKNVPPKKECVLPFADEEIDRHLPHGGIELGALHEIGAAQGIIHEATATMFVAGNHRCEVRHPGKTQKSLTVE